MFRVRLIQAENLRRILVAVFYAAYAISMTYLLFTTSDPETKRTYGILLALCPFGIWFEVLRYLYYKGFNALYEECDPQRAMKLASFVRKGDLLRQYQITAPNLEASAILDTGRPQDVEPFLQKCLYGYSQKKLSVDFEYQYLLFSAYSELNNTEKLKSSYQALEKVFRAVQRPSEALISLRNTSAGIFLLSTGKPHDALEKMQLVDPSSLKPRERCRYFFYLSRLFNQLGQKENAELSKQKAQELANGITLFNK